jgi:hypothetical protein
MIRLSVNVNKVATLRNSRGGRSPDVLEAVEACIAAGAPGITVHPRADRRHIAPADVRENRRYKDHEDFSIQGVADKFKAEALPLKDKVGGYRVLFSHNVEFGLSEMPNADRGSMAGLVELLPALGTLKHLANQNVEQVSAAFVEEVLQDIGILDFGKGITAKANVALWRQRGDHRPLVGEFAYQIKAKRRDDVGAARLGPLIEELPFLLRIFG